MNLELNLVKTQSIYSRVSSSIARQRTLINNESEAMSAIMSFIADNIEIFDAALSNKALVNQLQNLTDLTIDEFSSLKFMLASNGLDILAWAISDNELNEIEVPDGILEYNIVDRNNSLMSFLDFCTKINISEESGTLADMYQRIVDMYGLFEGDLFVGYLNPLSSQVQVLRQTEQTLGVTPNAITTYLNSVLEYLGKEIYVITI